MVNKTPVFSDQRPEIHRPNSRQELFREQLLSHYCVFREAHRILLSFCTFSTLTGGTGYTTVQVPYKRGDVKDPMSHWAVEFRKIRPRNGMILQVQTTEVSDVRVEVVPGGRKVGAFYQNDLEQLDKETVRPVFKCKLTERHAQSLG